MSGHYDNEAERVEAGLRVRIAELEREVERLQKWRAGTASIDEILDFTAARLAVAEWFRPINSERTGWEVEKFKDEIRRELLNAACALAEPYRDRAERAEALLAERATGEAVAWECTEHYADRPSQTMILAYEPKPLPHPGRSTIRPLYASPPPHPDEALVKALRRLYRGYVNSLESGRDRILFLGGDCDPVDVMERGDPHLREARAILSQHGSKP
jgi:hypothetical protein